MRSLLLPVLVLVAAQSAPPGFDHDHSAWTRVLEEHRKPDGFDYRALKADPGGLDAYLDSLEAVRHEDFRAWEPDQRYAFWINAYNAYTVKRVIDGYPVDSIKDLGSLFRSVWKQRFVPLGHLRPELDEEELHLDELEHEILRPVFRDARVHAAINCASKSCPPLLGRAYVAGELDEQLDTQARAWLADERMNRFDPERREAHVSKIFEWFEEDFEREARSVTAWLAKYAPEPHAEWLRSGDVELRYLDYDWSLNETGRSAAD